MPIEPWYIAGGRKRRVVIKGRKLPRAVRKGIKAGTVGLDKVLRAIVKQLKQTSKPGRAPRVSRSQYRNNEVVSKLQRDELEQFAAESAKQAVRQGLTEEEVDKIRDKSQSTKTFLIDLSNAIRGKLAAVADLLKKAREDAEAERDRIAAALVDAQDEIRAAAADKVRADAQLIDERQIAAKAIKDAADARQVAIRDIRVANQERKRAEATIREARKKIDEANFASAAAERQYRRKLQAAEDAQAAAIKKTTDAEAAERKATADIEAANDRVAEALRKTEEVEARANTAEAEAERLAKEKQNILDAAAAKRAGDIAAQQAGRNRAKAARDAPQPVKTIEELAKEKADRDAAAEVLRLFRAAEAANKKAARSKRGQKAAATRRANADKKAEDAERADTVNDDEKEGDEPKPTATPVAEPDPKAEYEPDTDGADYGLSSGTDSEQSDVGGSKADLTDSNQLEQYCKRFPGFIGAFRIDELEDYAEDFLEPGTNSAVVLTDIDRKTGVGHWNLLIVENDLDRERFNIYWYDPMGDKPPAAVKSAILDIVADQPVKYELKINRVENQARDSDLCGYHCMAMLAKLYHGDSWAKATGYQTDDTVKAAKPYFAV